MTPKPVHSSKTSSQPIKINGAIEGFYQQLIEQAADGIFTVSLKGEILYANKAACDIVKLPPRKIIGNHFMLFLDRRSRPKSKEYILQVKKGVTPMRDELVIKDSKGKKKPIEFTASPIYQGKEVVQIHISIRDISRRKNLEEYARESVKSGAIQNFISGTTHEIQSPLKGLLSQTQSLIDKYKDRDFEYIGFKEFTEIFETLVHMRDKAQYCCDTTDRLINMSRGRAEHGQKSSDVNKVVRDSVQSLKDSLVKSGVNVRLHLSSHLPPAAIGEVELGQVIVKIITNSIQSLTRDGHIDFKTAFSKKENKIRIDCVDDGIGIPKENLPKVFDPFFTTREKGEQQSAGLGLAIAHSIMKSCQGNIVISSHQNQGTRVKLVLPVFKKTAKK
ncbi:MAG: nitrogen regulation protein NR(II) [Candidatus Omnitrophota bacterium]